MPHIHTETRMSHFLGRFPTVESRHAAAVQLADSRHEPPSGLHISWNLLLAHWGDSVDSIREIGDFAWRLHEKLPWEATPVAIVTEGSAADLLEREPKNPGTVKFTYGLAARKIISYGFSGHIPGETNGNGSSSHLRFGLRVKFINPYDVRVGSDGYYEAEPRRGVDREFVKIYGGVVPLNFNLEDYQAGRQITANTVDIFIGKKVCRDIEDAVRLKTDAASLPRLVS